MSVSNVMGSPVNGLCEVVFENNGKRGVLYIPYSKKHIIAMKKADQSKKAVLRNLQTLINIGPAVAEKLYSIGVRSPEELRKADPEELYRKLQEKLGCYVDRCVLYVFRGAKTGRPWPKCSDNPKARNTKMKRIR